jgi:hypothetical protein
MFRCSRNGFGFSVIAYVGMTKYLFLLALAGAYLAGRADVSRSAKLENARVRVTELDYEPGQPRARSIRASDQVIVFLDDSKYERIDPDTGAKEVRTRKSGNVIWHNKGEIAPVLRRILKKRRTARW